MAVARIMQIKRAAEGVEQFCKWKGLGLGWVHALVKPLANVFAVIAGIYCRVHRRLGTGEPWPARRLAHKYSGVCGFSAGYGGVGSAFRSERRSDCHRFVAARSCSRGRGN